ATGEEISFAAKLEVKKTSEKIIKYLSFIAMLTRLTKNLSSINKKPRPDKVRTRRKNYLVP
ncbi:MAG: hypothetical protein WCH62_08175, partial [Candidatus Omnitrophota bacterium]